MDEPRSQRYKKALVTVAMGFRTEKDIKKNGLYIYTRDEKEKLIEHIQLLFNKNKSVFLLKVKQTGYSSEHVSLDSKDSLNEFIRQIDDIYKTFSEIWVVSSSIIECWRCRINLSNEDFDDTIEMAYSGDDHILDHIYSGITCPYILYKISESNLKTEKTNLKEKEIQETSLIVRDIMSKYKEQIQKIKDDLEFIGIDEISLDVRVNNGYDFHDFDVAYTSTEKVINYYVG